MRLLLVEDEPKLAESIARGLRQAAHAVDTAERLAVARQKVAIEDYDAVILDVRLPDGSGFEWTRELREQGNRIPILFLTARDSVGDRVAGLDVGGDDYLVKPFAQEELLARLRALARRPRETRAPTITVSDLEIDPASRSARRGGRPIELTTTEFALLEYLARQEGVVCGRAQVSAHVWDENYNATSNIIDVYIARLRAKVDGPGLPPLLHTVRGAGYVLRQPGSDE